MDYIDLYRFLCFRHLCGSRMIWAWFLKSGNHWKRIPAWLSVGTLEGVVVGNKEGAMEGYSSLPVGT